MTFLVESGIPVAAGSREIMVFARRTPTHSCVQYQPILFASTLFRFASGLICTSKFCAGPVLSSVPSTAISEKMVSEIIGAPSPYHSSFKFFAHPFRAALNPITSVKVFSGEKKDSGLGVNRSFLQPSKTTTPIMMMAEKLNILYKFFMYLLFNNYLIRLGSIQNYRSLELE